ncbi:ferritin [Brachyspira hampsonii]|uniref:Ferritin n=1 Tax=Brachyspira hampsonii 30446 TaxID=1289135 RepID=A0A2U4ETX6_9SPIR|nr:ferritin [Brachyspira hampsonii]EKV55996.1 non-heme iron-containing ferritin [Brachyspira hampsonii 30446]MBW5388613.1 ferritin [Brachyspira hampsonii]MBW5394587.1 ferritin [Brachyspira hampsonii]OEJ20410.1 ferritin [Brachyspira hampsonii]PTY40782.1 ferritin [Brachyspira hampsonii bv. II]
MSIIKEDIIKLLNVQLNKELYSASFYFNMAGWCDKKSLKGCSSFLYGHYKEELEHFEKFRDFINKVGGQAVISDMHAPQSEFNSVEHLFETVLKHEEYITSCINELLGKAMENKDYITSRFLDWFIQEQLEEEELFHDIMAKIKMLGGGNLEGRNLYTFDKAMNTLNTEKHSSGLDINVQ